MKNKILAAGAVVVVVIAVAAPTTGASATRNWRARKT